MKAYWVSRPEDERLLIPDQGGALINMGHGDARWFGACTVPQRQVIERLLADLAEVIGSPPEEIEEWVTLGIEKGWCSDSFCETHDMAPLTHEEIERLNDDEDPCIPALRIWADGPPVPPAGASTPLMEGEHSCTSKG